MRTGLFSRDDWRQYGLFLGTATAVCPHESNAMETDSQIQTECVQCSAKKYNMKSSINMWAFPYPDKMNLEQCFALAKRAGFDGIELNFNLEGEISHKTSEKDFRKIRVLAEKTGISISGLCTFLYWPYPFTANQESIRSRALELAKQMIHATHHLGTTNLLVVAGAVNIPWIKDAETVPYQVCDERARAAIKKLIPVAEKLDVNLNIENIFFNGYLMSPRDLIEFVDSFRSPKVNIHFDTGNIMPFQFPEHWIPLLGHRIKNVHLKEYSKNGTDFTLESFRPLLDGTTNWPAVMEEFDGINYEGYLTFEYFHPFSHYPEALIYQTSDAINRMLGRPSR
jgi:hexulose-6-phosphate isomerase